MTPIIFFNRVINGPVQPLTKWTQGYTTILHANHLKFISSCRQLMVIMWLLLVNNSIHI